MKKLLFLKLLALVVCLSSALSVTAYDFKYGNFYYNILTNTSSSRTVEVTNSGSNSSTDYPNSSYSVPSTVTYNGYTYTVTAIGDYAFANYESGVYGHSDFTSITLPSTITKIGEGAFQRTGISTITLPSNLTTIGEYAFYHIYNLTSITIPNSVTSIGKGAFSQCWYLQTVNLGSGLTSIPDYCFSGCDMSLTSITIPNQVQTIGDYAFYHCKNLKTAILGFSLTSIGDHAFQLSTDQTHCSIDVYCYAYDPPTIQLNTFDRWDNNGGIYGRVYTLARRVNEYKNAAVWYRFGESNFYSHSGNEYYDYSYNGVYYYFDPSFQEAVVTYKDTNYNSYSGQVTIPATVSWRGTSFYVDYIDNNAFRNCTGLTRFDASSASHLSRIYSYAFYGCTSLSNVYLPSSISTIENYAFYNCPLSYLKVPRSTPPTVYANTFTGNYSSCIVVVPTPADILTYQATDYWKKFLKYASIQDYDFSYNGLYYAITGSNTVKVVHRNLSEYGNPAYNYHGDIVIPATVPYNGTTYSVTAIDDCAFSQRVSDNKSGDGEPTLGATYDPLTSVTIGSNVKTIGEEAFEYASSLTTITIPNNVTSIAANAFEYSGLKSVTLGTGLTSIGANAFLGCTALTTIRSNRTTPPTIQSTTFETSHYSAATVYVPSSAVNSYKNKTYWKNFYLIVPNNGTELNYVLNVSGGNISFTSTGDYPWTIKADANRTYAQSSNAGVASTTSTMTATVTVTKASTVSFDFKAWGEGTNYDVCTFEIDGVQQFKYGARQNDWENFTADLAVGAHTLTWTYSKDSSVNPTGDYFAVDNVAIAEKVDAPGDVNGDGSVTIADVTALIDILLSGVNAPAGADVNGDNAVTIADVTALIDMLLAGN